MSKLRGRRRRSNASEMILVPVDPRMRRRIYLFGGAALLLVLVAVFIGGRISAERADRQVVSERTRLLQETRQLTNSLQAAREELVLHRTGSEMATQAQEQLRQELRGLRDQIAELEEAVAFYKNVMSPGAGEEGLRIERLEVTPTSQSGTYGYRLVLTQVGDNSSFISGNVSVSLDGMRDGEPFTVQTDELMAEQAETRFRFRYFQELGGRIQLPDDFTPQQLRVEAASSGRGAQTVERNFSWQVQERDGAWAG